MIPKTTTFLSRLVQASVLSELPSLDRSSRFGTSQDFKNHNREAKLCLQGALNQNSCGRGRKKRQTSFPGSSSGSGSQSPEFSQAGVTGGGGGGGDQELDGDERFFLPSGGSCSCNGRRKRQAPAEADINNRKVVKISF